ncbi:alpha/beta fold hydrolase [Emticicia sp.]|uniref:alpha/beta fold hydrolase n=1 Tax=Emticicia sp. TaxID=1930953 RepID=UPI0037535CC2
MKLFFRKTGEGQPILILHGIFGSSDNWFSISKMIAEKGYAIYALDARNHGQSPRSEEFSYELMAADLNEFIEHHQLEKPVIIGHSMGGKTVMHFAMKYPEKFSKLIIVDIAPKFYPYHHGHIIQGLNSIDLENLKSRNDAETQLAKFVSNIGERQFLLKNIYRTEDAKFDWRINLPVLSKEIYQVGGDFTDVHEVNEPVLFIRGSESGYIFDEDIPTIKKIFLNAIIETIVGAGHWVQAEKPLEFVEAVIDFLNKK